MKSILFRSICCAAILGIVAGCGNQKKKEAAEAAEKAKQDSLKQVEMIQKQKEAETLISQLPDEPIFDIVTNFGTIKVKLYSKTPKHRANFEKLALSGFYDGLLFHRASADKNNRARCAKLPLHASSKPSTRCLPSTLTKAS